MSNHNITNSKPSSIARHFHSLGMNVFPIVPNAKRPAVKAWEQWQTREQTAEEVESLDWTGSLAGITGPGGFGVFDLDHASGDAGMYSLLDLLDLPEDYEWVVKSGNGYHIWFTYQDKPAKFGNIYTEAKVGAWEEFEKLGLFFAEKYVLLPPSSHKDNPDGYRFLNCDFPTSRPAELQVSDAYIAYCVTTNQKTMWDQEVEEEAGERVETRSDGEPDKDFGRRSLKDLYDYLEGQIEDRNKKLHWAACRAGSLVAGGCIEEFEAIEMLKAACEANGYTAKDGTRDVSATIHSGLRMGKKTPVTGRATKQGTGNFLLDLDASDRGHAAAVLHRYPERIKYTGAVGWMVWNGTHYETDSEARVGQMIADTLQARREAAVKGEHSEKNETIIKQCVTNHMRMRDVKAQLADLAYAKIKDFDQDRDLLNVANGVLNLRTGQLAPHQPGQLFTYCLETRWNPNASSDQWEAFIGDAVKGGEEMADFLRKSVGYSLTGHTREEHMWYIYGPSRAGKGVFVETLRALLGDSLSAGVPFTTFTQKREGQNFDLARLKASRLVVASESSRYQRLNGEMVKDITGGGVISASFKHKDTFEYKPDFKIWVTSNFPVNGDPDDDALWGRIHVVEFPHSHLGSEDTGMKARMQSQECLEGLLVWAVKGAQEWYEEGRLVAPAISTEAKDTHREQADSVGLWLAECCEIGEGKFTATRRVRANYEQWCEENGFEAKGAKTFNESLTRRGMTPNYAGRDPDFGPGTSKGVKGLGLLAA